MVHYCNADAKEPLHLSKIIKIMKASEFLEESKKVRMGFQCQKTQLK